MAQIQKQWPGDTKAAMKADWIGNVHFRDMMVKYGCSKGSLMSLCRRGNWPTRDYVRHASANAAPPPIEKPRGVHRPQHSTANEPAIDLAAQRAHDARMARPVITARPLANPFAVPVRLAPKLECTSYKPRGGDRDERVSEAVTPLVAPALVSEASPQPNQKIPRSCQPEVARPTAPKIEAPVKYGRIIECCWPIGHPENPGFSFCGAASLPATPYCQEHATRAYARSAPKHVDAGLPG